MNFQTRKFLSRLVAHTRKSGAPRPVMIGRSGRTDVPPLRICAVDFWPDFSLEKGFLSFVLKQAFGGFEIVDREASADIVLASVFPHKRALHPEKTIALIWENIRPNYEFYRFSISSDFDDYHGRNFRLPNWYAEIVWAEELSGPKGSFQSHGYEDRVDLERLLRPHEIETGTRKKFCCLVTSYRESHRALAVEALSAIAPVDVFGSVTGSILRQSKYAILRDYRFNLCFENSMFPGYYTEKPLHAWAAGCVPLYFSDPYYTVDFNPRAMINRISFPSLAAFVEKVREVDQSPSLLAAFGSEPLLARRPTLDPLVLFIRAAAEAIVSATASASSTVSRSNR